jgi:hypothetical protein
MNVYGPHVPRDEADSGKPHARICERESPQPGYSPANAPVVEFHGNADTTIPIAHAYAVQAAYATIVGQTTTIYAATANGVSISTDGGQSFTNTTNGLGSNVVRGVYAVGSGATATHPRHPHQ